MTGLPTLCKSKQFVNMRIPQSMKKLVALFLAFLVLFNALGFYGLL